ncbi:MAG: site-2 protease family protein [Bacteroidia bacterium]|nr:site-2 protease family protein [Bacteroidia bacterium]
MDKNPQRYWLHILLFVFTVFTTMLAGAELATGHVWLLNILDDLGLMDKEPDGFLHFHEIWKGIPHSAAFLAFLTFHEFGHYFTSVYHKVKCSLPYYIPIFIPILTMNIGSFGAVIRIREVPSSTKKFFDIGVAGPLAGFVVSLIILIIGFSTLPPLEEKIFSIHPQYETMYHRIPTGEELQYYPGPQEVVNEETGEKEIYPPDGYIKIGTSLLFELFKWIFATDPNRIPPDFELMHYPLLFVGFLTLFFTALNLLPIGQLDGGHVVYGLFGARRAGIISRVTVLVLLSFGGTGLVEFSGWDQLWGPGLYLMFLVFVFQRLLGDRPWIWIVGGAVGLFIIQGLVNFLSGGIEPGYVWLIYSLLAVRLIGLDHPRAHYEHPLDRGRKIVGWIAIIIFILCFSPNPIIAVEGLLP